MAHHPYPWRDVFLAALREWPVVTHACEVVNIQRSTAYRERERDPEFAKAWDDAMESGVDRAEKEAFRRAVEGVEDGVWHQGVQVGTKRVYSDSLMALVLKARRKSVYADRTELTGANGGPVQTDDAARAARVAQIIAEAQRRRDALAQAPDEAATGFEDLA